jgi:hypothetical protein
MRGRTIIPILLIAAGAFPLAFWAGSLRAQVVTGMIATSFRVQLETHPPPFETQIKTLLEGRNAEQIPDKPDGRILLIEPKLSRLSTNGTLEVQVRSPECIYNTMQRTVSSTNVLQVEMAEGRFYTEGRGFLCTTNSTIISNDVHTIIRIPERKLPKP